MAQNVSLIGVHPDELPWMRRLISLLRHPDPAVPELARQAIQFLTETAGTYGISLKDSPGVGAPSENSHDSSTTLVS
jgi:hypothetical protein